MAAPNSNYATDLAATTFEKFFATRPSDVVFGELVLWDQLAKGGKKSIEGGSKILVPIAYQASTAVGSYSGYDLLDTSPQEGLTNAEFDWKWYYGTVTIDNPTTLMNRGPAAMLNILKARIAQAEMSLAAALNEDLFLDGTGNSSKDITGLALAIDSAGTYGNIARGTYSWWASTETGAGGAISVALLRQLYNDISLGPTRRNPDLVVTTQDVFQDYEALMDSNTRYTVLSEGHTLREQRLKFRNCDWFWDDDCQSQVLYMINTKHLKIVEMSTRGAEVVNQEEDRDVGSFRLEPFQTPINQDAKSAKFFWAGQTVSDHCARNGKLTGVT